MSVPSGVICTPEDYARSIHQPASIHCLTRGQTIGLMVITSAGIISLTAILYVFFLILRNINRRGQTLLQIFHLPMDVVMFSLFLAETLQAIGGIVNVKWIRFGKVEVGQFCQAQGIIQSIGESSVAFSTLVIAIYTFLAVWVGLYIHSIKITSVIVLGLWLLIAILVIIGNTTNPNLIGPTPNWCFVIPIVWKIFLGYVWLWITLLVSLCVYIVLTLWMRGNLVNNGPRWWNAKFRFASNASVTRRQAFIMALYPLVYAISILPTSTARWIGFVQEAKYHHDGVNRVPAAITFIASTIFRLSGFFNVVLLLTTRPDTELFGGTTSNIQGALPPTGPPPPSSTVPSPTDTSFSPPAVPLQPIVSPPAHDQGWLP